jgi:hypothetical protein
VNNSRLRHATLLAAVALVATAAEPVAASQWLFEPSYFSRGVPPELAEDIPHLHGRTAYRRPYANALPGGSVRGGIRWNRVNIQNGTSSDTILIRENWHQFQPGP